MSANPTNTPDKSAARPSRLRRWLRIILFLVALLAIGYFVENWRGSRAWKACKSELKAKGEELDWLAYIPKPVPDEQNMMTVPLVESWFIRHSKNTKFQPRFDELSSLKGLRKAVAEKYARTELVILLPAAQESPAPGDVVLSLDALGKTNFPSLLKSPEATTGRRFLAPANYYITARVPTDRKPQRIFLRAESVPPLKQMEEAIKKQLPLGQRHGFNLRATDKEHVFSLSGPWDLAEYAAADFLAWVDQFKSEFDIIHEAAKRPHVRIETDYNQPHDIQMPNFVAVRVVCQVAAARALANMLVDRPDEAVKDLALIHDVDKCLKGNAPNLVSSMIRVAVMGLFVTTTEKGFLEGVWQEPQWVALQEEMRQMDRLGEYALALRGGERAGIIYMLETYPRSKMAKLTSDRWWEPTSLYFQVAPRGWFQQNLALISRNIQGSLEALDLKQMRVYPAKAKQATAALEAEFDHWSPYNCIAAIVVPNTAKALMTATKNQVWVHQALLVCALERARKAEGAYPASLEALAPKYLAKLPPDLLTGEPFKYRRLDNNKFLLYSVGWDGKDDGGKASQYWGGTDDWVWGSQNSLAKQ